MTPFRFPPPPPPPPSTGNAQDTSQNGYSSNQRGGYNNPRGRGWRGRGGGGRGRGNNDRGNTRGGYGQNNGRSDGNWQPHTQQAPENYAAGLPTTLPPGPYVNPRSQWAAAGQAQTASVGSRNHFNSTSNPSDQHHTGKRKRESSQSTSTNPHVSSRSPQQSKKPQRVKAETAPPIPSFGFSLPGPRPTASHPAQSGKKGASGQKVHLGLTPRNEEAVNKEPDNSGGEEEDVDEEAVLGKEFNGISFEYNGQLLSLQTPAEIAAFMKERKRQYPTKQRIAEKARERATKRERELEFLRKVKAQTSKSKGIRVPEGQNGGRRETKQQPRPDAVSEKQKQLAALRKRVEASAASRKAPSSTPNLATTSAPERKAPNINLGVNYESDTSESEVSSVVSSSEEDTSEAESDSEDEDDSDEAPDEQTSKIEPPKPKPPPPPQKSVVTPNARVCDHWKRDGHCKFGKRCRYAHPPREPKKRLGLYDVFVQKEKEQADALALQAIKYLGSHGLLG